MRLIGQGARPVLQHPQNTSTLGETRSEATDHLRLLAELLTFASRCAGAKSSSTGVTRSVIRGGKGIRIPGPLRAIGSGSVHERSRQSRIVFEDSLRPTSLCARTRKAQMCRAFRPFTETRLPRAAFTQARPFAEYR